jgi:bleomycin hydrolase
MKRKERYMKKICVFLLAIGLVFGSIVAADDESAVTGDMLKNYSEQVKSDETIKMKTNALTNNNIKELTLNWDIVNSFDFQFTKKLDMYTVTAQEQTGRCWLFAALNVMRRDVAKRLKMSNFELSQTYNYFYDKLEKSNMFLEYIIANADKKITDRAISDFIESPTADGGWWNYAVELIKKYGVVPKSVMRENVNSENSGQMLMILDKLLRRDAFELRKKHSEGANVKALREEKIKMLGDIYKVLVMHLGEPPQKFNFRYEDKDQKLSDLKEYTPQSFLKEIILVNLDDYVVFMNDPRYPFGKLYRFELGRDMVDKEDFTLINVDIKILKSLTMKSLLGDDPVWFAADVGQQSERKKGILADHLYEFCKFLDTCICMDKAARIDYHDENPNHAMVFAGVDIQNDKPVKWLVENSWGTQNGKDGYFVMYDNWFDEFVLCSIVNKKYVTPDLMDILKAKPVILSPWDAMAKLLRNVK